MSFLQIMCANKINKNKNIEPSPANKIVFVQKLLSQIKQNQKLSVKRIFGSISYSELSKVNGSMSIEAALLLPLVLFFFLHLSGVMEMLLLHSKLEAALWSVGNQMAVCIDDFSQKEEQLSDDVLSYLIINGQIKTFLGKTYLENSPLKYGADGLNYLKSDFLNQEECVDIEISYQVKPKVTMFPFGYCRMNNRCYVRAWTGYDLSYEDEIQRYVYVTPAGEVWHSTPECTYLSHKVDEVDKKDIRNKRNSYGKKYELCELCKSESSGNCVYITKEGEKYHFLRTCGAIYKRIIAVKWSEGISYRACSRCVEYS